MNTSMKVAASVVAVFVAGLVAFLILRTPKPIEQPKATPPKVQPRSKHNEPPPPVASNKPNVLFIVWDTVRADHMSLYGHNKATTPRLEQFAKEAVVYEQATSPGMWTLPSHTSMFTGLAAKSHGATAERRWVDFQHHTLAEILSEQGYDTWAFSSNLIASPMTNLTQGFKQVHTSFPRKGVQRSPIIRRSKEATRKKRIPSDKSTEISPAFDGDGSEKWAKAVHKDAASVAVDTFLQFVDTPKKNPWFAFINMMEAHTPRIPSLKNRKKLLTDEVLKNGLNTDFSLFAENEYIVGKRSFSNDELTAIQGVYDAAIRDLDDETGRLFEQLEQRGVLDNTIVVLVSDHGEMLGEHRMFEHRWAVWEPLFHVPLVIRYNKKLQPKRVKERVSTADVFSTVLDLAEVKGPSQPEVMSKSLVSEAPSSAVFGELRDPYKMMLNGMRRAHPKIDFSPWERSYKVAWRGVEKWIEASDGEVFVFDISKDPREEHNLASTKGDTATELREAFSKWQKALPGYNAAGRSEKDAPLTAPKPDEDELCGLCALGYVSGAQCDPCRKKQEKSP